MHGLILTAVRRFVLDCYGAQVWQAVAARTDFARAEIDMLQIYDQSAALRVLDAAATVLQRPQADILEDIGTYLVAHPSTQRLRRLLRFGGVTFEDFLHSLNDLPDRARLAVADLSLPALDLQAHQSDRYTLIVRGHIPGFGHVMVGLLRSMADDYGALATVDHLGQADGAETVNVALHERTFARGRSFFMGAELT